MVVLDLFSGAGGLSEGFFEAGAVFAAHIEADKHACNTLKTRQSYWNLKAKGTEKIYEDYLLKKIDRETLWDKAELNRNLVINEFIDNSSIEKLKKQVHNNLKEINKKKIDVIIGGPPCQAYSVIGRARMGEKVKKDERNYLFRYYIEFLKEFQPKMFVFENVPGLLSAGNGEYLKELIQGIENSGYHMEMKILTATDFGVLQNRKRVIIIGWNKNIYKEYIYPDFYNKFPGNAKVGLLLEDLPFIKDNSKIEGKNMYTKEPNDYLIWSGIRQKGFNILTQHETRPTNDNDKEIYKIAVKEWFEKRKLLKYNELAETHKHLIKHKNTKVFVNRFNVVKPDKEYSHTIVAHIAMDGHYYIHPDINQNRSISIREAARIQSFPDDFFFEGPRTAIFRQIGNAVPPLMAKTIAKKIKEML
ncbi:DNA (cytosine-5)-methyltransferase 1 [Lebetimonas natsushimae]|uniref:Cytosine-specific methyltransferase n=1 Tax=Lebetimonas natsushimae TaxID=1936991 RepID=A0A292YC05_9BACT|nr:DNA cytosine methyltransferase [Lebetimonas natsushimae]GAX87021.1 DNA (cytosine-5)-methyltransferase 1 [Lebetimonas natsushimae]